MSAVDILNAEAGSLLLVSDDNPNELEFKVVIGGAGQNLLGQRLKADYGLVGEVMRTGQPQIQNTVSNDARREERPEFSGYKTQSILAVPLIAKDRIIGVLEVLNRRDGTAFVHDDEELLTTLSGQAAVAIENARCSR